MGRVVTILGMGPSAYRKADCIGQFISGSEVWGLNNGYGTFPTLTESKGFARYFELHSWEYLKTWSAGEVNGNKIDHCATLRNLNCPIYTTEPLPLIRNQVEFPALEILRYFGKSVEIKGSPSWMLALALWEHAQGQTIDKVQSYGIDTSDAQHACQRPSWAQWTLRAELAGIEVGGTALDFRYGPDQDEGLTGLLERKKSQLDQE